VSIQKWGMVTTQKQKEKRGRAKTLHGHTILKKEYAWT
jgi:hypothetical protein